MKFEWNLQKAALNLLNHGVSFEEAALVFFGTGIWLQGRRLRGKLDDLIEQERQKTKAEEKNKAIVPVP